MIWKIYGHCVYFVRCFLPFKRQKSFYTKTNTKSIKNMTNVDFCSVNDRLIWVIAWFTTPIKIYNVIFVLIWRLIFGKHWFEKHSILEFWVSSVFPFLSRMIINHVIWNISTPFSFCLCIKRSASVYTVKCYTKSAKAKKYSLAVNSNNEKNFLTGFTILYINSI